MIIRVFWIIFKLIRKKFFGEIIFIIMFLRFTCLSIRNKLRRNIFVYVVRSIHENPPSKGGVVTHV